MALTFLLSALCSVLLLAQVSQAQHGEEAPAGGETMSMSKSSCAVPLDDLHNSIEGVFGANYTVYINCLSFDSRGYLNRGIASGQSTTSGSTLRYELLCRGNVIVALELSTVDMPLDTTDMRDSSCLDCVDNTTACTQPCGAVCERCYETPTQCSRCHACTSLEAELCRYEEGRTLQCAAECPEATLPGPPHYRINHEEYNYCECIAAKNLLSYPTPNPNSEEEEIECPAEEEPRPYTCDTGCTITGFDVNNETGICFACGIEYCVRCNRQANPPACLTCLEETVLYEHECIACPRAPIAIAALEQEEEIKEEEDDRELRTIELAVSLPIVCVLIVVFFVSMSIFAHRRYPHVSHHGKKRHRRPPTTERSVSPADGQDVEQLQESNVWRPRPTIILR